MEDDKKEYQFIKEKIVRKEKSKGKAAVLKLVLLVFGALVFGVVARFAFVWSGEFVDAILGVEDDDIQKQTVVLAGNNNEPTVTPPVSTGDDSEASGDNIPAYDWKDIADLLKGENVSDTAGEQKTALSLEDYAAFYAEIQKLASDLNSSMAQVTAKFSEKNWLDEEVSYKKVSSAVVLQDNRVDLLILAPYSGVKNAESIEVMLVGGIKYDARLISYDEDYNLAIIGINLYKIPFQYRRNITYASFSQLNYVLAGTPVLLAGNLNGYSGSFDFGMITAKGGYKYILDDRLELFTLSCTTAAGSNGIVVDLNGEIIGFLDESGSGYGAATIISGSRVKNIIETLANEKSLTYFGIVAEELPEEVLENISSQSGIYVSEVKSDSPAAKAGIKKGDIIYEINDTSIFSVAYFNKILRESKEGDELKVELYRNSFLEYKAVEAAVIVGVKE